MTNRCEQICSASQCECQDAIDTINDLWPPDSDYPDTRARAREDLIEALCEQWRSLPLAVLQHMASVQLRRDNAT